MSLKAACLSRDDIMHVAHETAMQDLAMEAAKQESMWGLSHDLEHSEVDWCAILAHELGQACDPALNQACDPGLNQGQGSDAFAEALAKIGCVAFRALELHHARVIVAKREEDGDV